MSKSTDTEPARAAVDALVEAARSAQDVAAEIERLRAISAWALSSLHIRKGDRVVIAQPIRATGGWGPYREVLVVGCTGVVGSLDLYDGAWRCLFVPDIAWTVADPWTPGGAPRRYQSKSGKCFMLPIENLRQRSASDAPLPMPTDAELRRP